MSSRITQGMMNSQLLLNLNRNLNRMDNLQNQMATGRRINKPSDDPVGISFSMRYRSGLAANDQYLKNVDSAVSWLEYTDSAMNQANSLLQRIRELMVDGANGTNPQTALDAIQSEVIQLRDQMVTVGNSQFNGKYVFNGQMTDVEPYSASTAAMDVTDAGQIQFEIGAGVRIPVNISGSQVFGDAGSTDNVFQILDQMIADLGNGDSAAVGMGLENLDSRINHFLEIRAEVGAKVNRLELSQSRLEDISTNLQTLQSRTEDADMAEVLTNFKASENVYQASLSVGSKLIQPSLIDFLR